MNKNISAALCVLALLASPVGRAADLFSVPLHDGQTLSFVQSGSSVDSNGISSSWGPVRFDAHLQAVDMQLLGQHVDWRLVDNDDTRFTAMYLAQVGTGVWRVAEGNPEVDAVYRYYPDPEPWLYLAQPLEVGVPVNYTGLRRGQWIASGGGLNVWSGTWSETYTNLGHETVTTPLGTFDALKLLMQSVTTTDSSSQYPGSLGHATWDELRWFVPGFGYVKIQGSGVDSSDFDGNGVVDYWNQEEQTIFAVPEPAAIWSLLAGLATLGAVMRRRAAQRAG